MAVRSMKLKMKTNSSGALDVRKGLWRSHVLLNDGVAYYMDWLVHLRQEELEGKKKEEIQADLLRRLRTQQQENGTYEELGTDSELLKLTRKLYELIVPSSVGKSGDSNQLSNKFLYPLLDAESVAGQGTSKAGQKPRWKKMQEVGDSSWEAERQKAMERKANDPALKMINTLSKFGLRPLFPMFTDTQTDIEWLPTKKGQSVRKWDKDMFIQSIERLQSWESWNRRVADEKEKLEQKRQELFDKYLTGGGEWIEKLQQFEKDRENELSTFSFQVKDGYRIKPREIRQWNDVVEKWSKLPKNANDQELWEVVAKEQSRNRGGFGDPVVYGFLAKKENRFIWHDDPSRLTHFVAHNTLLEKLQWAKERAALTLPHPRLHPLWIRYEGPGGSNLNKYNLTVDEKNISVEFDKMIWPGERGWTEKENIRIDLAPSKQFNYQVFLKECKKGKQEIKFIDYSSNEELEGELGGSRIQFDRQYISNRLNLMDTFDVGPVYFNLVMNIDLHEEAVKSLAPKALKVQRRQNSTGFPKVTGFKPKELQELITQNKKTALVGTTSLTEGMRVMSIDLGQRTSAAVSIFEVQKEKPLDDKKLFYPVKDTDLYAVHKRSFLLNLPGEDVSKNIEKKRKERKKKRNYIRLQIRMLAGILKLATKEKPDDRLKAIQKFITTIDNHEDWTEMNKAPWRRIFKQIEEHRVGNKDEWKEQLCNAHHEIEPYVAGLVSDWRKSLGKNPKRVVNEIFNREQSRKTLAGISLWNIEELEETRSILISWSKRSRVPGEPRAIDLGEAYGSGLLKHIQQVRDNRLKQLANLVVMTALGYVYDENKKSTKNRWVEKYPACQLILFENLIRYQFSQDRPRRENSKLMKWSHRSIPQAVWMQAEMFGIMVGDVMPEYSSRFHAKTGAPGIRCHALTEDDVKILNVDRNKEEKMRSYLYHGLKEAGWSDQEISSLKEGDFIPESGGELFATLMKIPSGNEKLAFIHADLNAAQNLQKRFWTQRSELFRARCKLTKTTEGECYVPVYDYEKKILGKGAFFQESEVYKWENSAKLKVKTTGAINEGDVENLEEIVEIMEMAEEQQGKRLVLFRDPSGMVFHKDCWYSQKDFWSRVKARINKRLRDRITKKGPFCESI